MKRTHKKIITLAAITAFFAMGSVVYADTADIPASVTITAPTLDLTAPTAIDFGGIINGSVAAGDSQVRINSAANVDAMPAVVGGGDAALDGTGGSGSLTVESNVDATLDVSCTTVTGANGTGTSVGVSVLDTFGGDELTLLPATVTANSPQTLAVVAGTPVTLYVGGLLTIKNDTPEGNYEGTLEIDVSYP